MARIRSIKPDFWKSEAIAALSMQTRLTFIALWNYVDDNGVGRDNAQLIAAEVYPLEPDPLATLAHVRRSLDELSTRGRITRYTADGKAFFHVTNWSEHQKIDRPAKARYPGPDDPGSTRVTCDDAPDASAFDEPSSSPRRALDASHLPEKGEGSREQGGKEQGAGTPTLEGNRLLAAHCEARREPLPRAEKGKLGREIDALLAEGISPDRVKAGLAVMRTKPHMGPSLLPAAVAEADQSRIPAHLVDLPSHERFVDAMDYRTVSG